MCINTVRRDLKTRLATKPKKAERKVLVVKKPAVSASQVLLQLGVRSQPAEEEARLGTRAFIGILQHSRGCGGCEDIKCKKMKMVWHHYVRCTKLKTGIDCSLCRQLLRVVAEHSLYLCPNRAEGLKLPCQVPMCDVMRSTAALLKAAQ